MGEDIAELVQFTKLKKSKIRSDFWGEPEHMPANVRTRLASEINGIANKFHDDLDEYRRAPDAKAVRAHFSRIHQSANSLYAQICEKGEVRMDLEGEFAPLCSPFVEYMFKDQGLDSQLLENFLTALLKIRDASEALSCHAPSAEAAFGLCKPSDLLVERLARLYASWTGAKPAASSESSILTSPFPRFVQWICRKIGAEMSPMRIRSGLAYYQSTLSELV